MRLNWNYKPDMCSENYNCEQNTKIRPSDLLAHIQCKLFSDTLPEVPMPKGASCPQSIFRPSLLFYLAPAVIAFLICNKNITSDIRHMYGNWIDLLFNLKTFFVCTLFCFLFPSTFFLKYLRVHLYITGSKFWKKLFSLVPDLEIEKHTQLHK